ncbi:TfoX/Sxy family protein [Flaviaesturariibacter amylovorans]|uniref:TfoX/Sxy family protein n=1 Tax=Flaviaesturariibacter amylovorans TaxID=1084520 RepID=A0ABP8G8C9_9BACT
MATDQTFVDFILSQLKLVGDVSAKKMFGEYGVYANGKLFGLVCDNKLFIKPTSAGRAFIGEVVEAPPYEGAKPSFLIEDRIEDRQWLSELVRLTVEELPEPKAKKEKKK